MLYIYSEIPSAVKINGKYYGQMKGLFKLSAKNNSLVEILPVSSLGLQIAFTSDFPESCPYVSVYRIDGDKFVVVDSFPTATLPYENVYARSHSICGTDLNVSLIVDGYVKLIVENPVSADVLPINVIPKTVHVEELYSNNGTYCLIDLQAKGHTLVSYKLDGKLALCFKQTVNAYTTDDNVETVKRCNDVLSSTVKTKWNTGNPFTVVSNTVYSDIPVYNCPPRNLPLAFFERIMYKGNIDEFVSDNLSGKTNLLFEYVGNFDKVIISPYNADEIITFDGFKANVFSVSVENKKIVNLTKLTE